MIYGGIDPSLETLTCARIGPEAIETIEAVDLPTALDFLRPCQIVCVEQPFAHFVQAGTLVHVLKTLEMAVTVRVAMNTLCPNLTPAFKATVQEIRSAPWGELTALEMARPTKGVKADDAMKLWLREVYLPQQGHDPEAIAALFKNTGKKPTHGPLSNSHKVDAVLAALHAQRLSPPSRPES